MKTDSEHLGLYYVREMIADVPITQLIMSKNRLTACIGFYDYMHDSIIPKHLNPANYQLCLVGIADINTYALTPLPEDKDSVVITGDKVRDFLVENGVFTSEVEDVMPSKDVEVVEHE